MRVGEKEKRNNRLVGVIETSRELAERHRLLQKNLYKLGQPKRQAWPRCHKVSSWQGRQSRLCQNEKEQSHLSRSPDREKVKVRKRRIKMEHGEERVDTTVKEGRFQRGEGGQAKRTSLEEAGEWISR